MIEPQNGFWTANSVLDGKVHLPKAPSGSSNRGACIEGTGIRPTILSLVDPRSAAGLWFVASGYQVDVAMHCRVSECLRHLSHSHTLRCQSVSTIFSRQPHSASHLPIVDTNQYRRSMRRDVGLTMPSPFLSVACATALADYTMEHCTICAIYRIRLWTPPYLAGAPPQCFTILQVQTLRRNTPRRRDPNSTAIPSNLETATAAIAITRFISPQVPFPVSAVYQDGRCQSLRGYREAIRKGRWKSSRHGPCRCSPRPYPCIADNLQRNIAYLRPNPAAESRYFPPIVFGNCKLWCRVSNGGRGP